MFSVKFLVVSITVFFLMIFLSEPVISQNKVKLHFFAGVTGSIGTYLSRVGIYSVFSTSYQNFQVSGRVDYHFNKKSFGVPRFGKELQFSVFGLVAFCEGDSLHYFYNDFLTNQTGKKYSFGFAYIRYFDEVGTSQPAGAIFLQAKNFELITENDLFGKEAADKFRTAAFKLSYRNEHFAFSLNSLMWTGRTGGKRIKDTGYPSRFGYKDLSKNQFGRFSHGIMSLQFELFSQKEFFTDIYRADFGADSEYVRHFFQNLLIHDMYFFPLDSTNKCNFREF